MRRTGRTAFTLIELLVVVAIIALLISILLPSLQRARALAKAAVCGAQMRGIGTGLATYTNDNNDWIPGFNTSGVATSAVVTNPAGLRDPSVPVQAYDWMSPILKYDTELGENRAERFQTLINHYQCPENAGVLLNTYYQLNANADAADFVKLLKDWSPISYLMPVHFQHWGQNDSNFQIAAGSGPRSSGITARVSRGGWDVLADDYRSKLQSVGNASRKVAAADGTRYLDSDQVLDFDPYPTSLFGSFTSAGAWRASGTAYGVAGNSSNWDGQRVSGGGSASQGENLTLSYRHTKSSSDLPVSAQSNTGSMNAMFFDGHVTRLSDRASRNIVYWYPKGSRVANANAGMTAVESDPSFRIP